MDFSIILVCVMLLALVFIPYCLFIAVGQSEKNKMKNKIKNIITQNNLNISSSENWGNRYLGIDTTQRKLMFFKSAILVEPLSEDEVQVIEMDSIKVCNINELRKPIKIGDRKEQILEKLELEILLKNGGEIILSFYHMDDDQIEDWEVRRIEKCKLAIVELTSITAVLNKAA